MDIVKHPAIGGMLFFRRIFHSMEKKEWISLLYQNRDEFVSVVPFNTTVDKLTVLDFTAANRELTIDVLENTTNFCDFIDHQLSKTGARYGIGGYNEHRTVYSISKIFEAEKPGDEPRRLHLGTDIWGKPNTAVIAPLDGTIHSFAFNNRFGDYGATIILTHELAGLTFFTLYGHLSLHSIKNICEGDHIERGKQFANFGTPAENGQWPPHLHFQIIIDIRQWRGDYPGVCKFSERDQWLANCPDPDTILQMNRWI